MTPPATAAASAPAVHPGRRARPARPPRRVSGPTRSPGRGAAAGTLALPATGIAVGALEALAHLSRHRMLDRLIRGRSWIGLVAFALIGIVAMQLWVLKLNAGIGRAVTHESWLQRDNSRLGIEISEISSGDLVEQAATEKGMVIVPPGALHFDRVRGPLDARLAAGALGSSSRVSASSTATGAGATASTSSSQASSGSSISGGEASSSGGYGSSVGGEESSTGGEASSAQSVTGTESASNSSSSAPPATSTGSESSSSSTAPGGSATSETSSSSSSSSSPSAEGSSEATSAAPVGAGGGIQAGQASGQQSTGQTQSGPQE
jgi:hypothetical protein